MPPTLILIRHAQALHNTEKAFHAVPDPPLTDLGRAQAAELREHLKTHLPAGGRAVQRIVVSPMRRAVQTALIALDWLIEAGVPVVPDARWQELYPKPCDTGTPASDLAKEFPTIDFTGLDPVYPDKTSPAGAAYAYSKEAVLARGQDALRELYGREEDVVVVVSHSGFLRTGVAGKWFGNADYRGFEFEVRDGEEEGRYRLVEIEATKGKGGMTKSKEGEVTLGSLPEMWN